MDLYIIHFSKPFKHAQHYIGIAEDAEKRFKRHLAGNGARLIRAAVQANIGIEFTKHIISTHDGYSVAKAEEKRIKSHKNHKKRCPECTP